MSAEDKARIQHELNQLARKRGERARDKTGMSVEAMRKYYAEKRRETFPYLREEKGA